MKRKIPHLERHDKSTIPMHADHETQEVMSEVRCNTWIAHHSRIELHMQLKRLGVVGLTYLRVA